MSAFQRTVPAGRSAFFCLLLALASRAELNLEGMTGYWMVPSAEVLPTDHLVFSVNSHKVGGQSGGADWQVATSPLPHIEGTVRYSTLGVRDLSTNAKVGGTVFETQYTSTAVAVGMEDVWGGARLFHSKYLVATQRLAWLEGSLGWGNGHHEVDTFAAGTGILRLGGIFWGAQLRLPLPDSFPVQLALLHDDDGVRRTTGWRTRLGRDDLSLGFGSAWDWTYRRWDWMGNLEVALPEPSPTPAKPIQAPLHLRVGPWVQSFLGTELGEFDAQVALEMTGIVTPTPWLVGHSRVRTRVWETDNFQDGGPFAKFRQEPSTWLEGAGVGVGLQEGGSGAWGQVGMVDGSWNGANLELATDEPGWGFRLGALAGAWYSFDWHGSRLVLQPWLDWNSRRRNWFARLDAGRYWNNDLGARVRVGRRYGRLAPSAGFARTDGTAVADVRLDLELDGVGWSPFRSLSLEPTPRFGHGYQTQVARANGDGNPLTPGTAKDPPLPLRARYGFWPVTGKE